MTWNYRIILHDVDTPPWLGLHEVYYHDDGRVKMWVEAPASFVSGPEEGPEGIVRALIRAESDAESRAVLLESQMEAGL